MEIHRIDLVNGIALSTNIVSTYSEITHSERNPFFNVLIWVIYGHIKKKFSWFWKFDMFIYTRINVATWADAAEELEALTPAAWRNGLLGNRCYGN